MIEKLCDFITEDWKYLYNKPTILKIKNVIEGFMVGKEDDEELTNQCLFLIDLSTIINDEINRSINNTKKPEYHYVLEYGNSFYEYFENMEQVKNFRKIHKSKGIVGNLYTIDGHYIN